MIAPCPAVPVPVDSASLRPGPGVASGADERGASNCFILTVPGILALVVCYKLSETYKPLPWSVCDTYSFCVPGELRGKSSVLD